MSRVNSSRLHQRCRRKIEFEEFVVLVSFTMSQKCQEFLQICFLFPCINFLDMCSQTVLNFSHLMSPLFFVLPSTDQNSFPHNGKHLVPTTRKPPTSTSWSSTFTPWWPIILKSSSQSIAVFTSVISPKKNGFSQVPPRFFQPGKRWYVVNVSLFGRTMIQWSIMVTSFMSLVGHLKCDSQKSSKSLRRFWRFRPGHGSLSPLSRFPETSKNPSRTFKKHDPAL